MGEIFNSIAYVLGYVLHVLYNNLWFNYGLAIITFTIILRFLLLPLTKKSFQSMLQTQEIQPIVNELQRKYKNDKEALNKEVMKLYQEKKVNPFGGCLPMLIQLPILYGLFMVIAQPVTFMFHSPEVVNTAVFQKNVSNKDYYKQVDFLNKIQKNPELFNELKKEIESKEGNTNIANKIEEKNIKKMNLHFLGINLGDVPKFPLPKSDRMKYVILLIIPLLSGFTTFLASKYGTLPVKSSEQTDMQKSMQTQMLIMMPLMTLYFSFLVPAGLSIYWIVSNIFQLVQQKVLINKYYHKKTSSAV